MSAAFKVGDQVVVVRSPDSSLTPAVIGAVGRVTNLARIGREPNIFYRYLVRVEGCQSLISVNGEDIKPYKVKGFCSPANPQRT
jgi:hypothetical protein